MTLKDLNPGYIAKVAKVNGQLKSKIMDMGITRGAEVRMRCCAPLGWPIANRSKRISTLYAPVWR